MNFKIAQSSAVITSDLNALKRESGLFVESAGTLASLLGHSGNVSAVNDFNFCCPNLQTLYGCNLYSSKANIVDSMPFNLTFCTMQDQILGFSAYTRFAQGSSLDERAQQFLKVCNSMISQYGEPQKKFVDKNGYCYKMKWIQDINYLTCSMPKTPDPAAKEGEDLGQDFDGILVKFAFSYESYGNKSAAAVSPKSAIFFGAGLAAFLFITNVARYGFEFYILLLCAVGGVLAGGLWYLITAKFSKNVKADNFVTDKSNTVMNGAETSEGLTPYEKKFEGLADIQVTTGRLTTKRNVYLLANEIVFVTVKGGKYDVARDQYYRIANVDVFDYYTVFEFADGSTCVIKLKNELVCDELAECVNNKIKGKPANDPATGIAAESAAGAESANTAESAANVDSDLPGGDLSDGDDTLIS